VKKSTSTYRDFEDLQGRVEELIERYYNQCTAKELFT
jgi:hypothetical protein